MPTKARNSNFELLRIMAILMIVLSHSIWHGVLKSGQTDAYALWDTGTQLFKVFTSMSVLGTIGVGLFFMITGYFTAHKEKTSIKKVCLITLFYAALTIIVLLATKLCGVNLYQSNGDLLIGIVKVALIPITGNVWWFVTAYVLLILFAPAYNRMIDKLNSKGLRILLLAFLFFGYTLGNLGSGFHDLEKALFFYTMGVYFRDCMHNDRLNKKAIFILLAIMGLVINGICQYCVFTNALIDTPKAIIVRKLFSMLGYFVADPMACYGIFGLFYGLRIQNRIINQIAAYTFGVYLFHESPPLRELIWNYILNPWNYFGTAWFYLFILICVVFVFAFGACIDIIREKFVFQCLSRQYNRLETTFKRKYCNEE